MGYKLPLYLFFLCFLPSALEAQPPMQNDVVAEGYYKKGEFNKALLSYERLLRTNPRNYKYVYNVIDIYQQLERFPEADAFIRQQLVVMRSPALLVELGYNLQLQDSSDKANAYYKEAITTIEVNPNYVYGISRRFEQHSLLDQAITAYEKAAILLPEKSFNIQLARIYGERGDIEQMFINYLNYIYYQPNFINNAKRAFNDFITDNSETENNQILRKLLLKKIQQQPDIYWYELLSWLYIQEGQYKKAFVQEKAIYKRFPDSLDRLFELGIFALEDKDSETSTAVFNFILQSAPDQETQLTAHQYLLELRTKNAEIDDLTIIEQDYNSLFKTYGLYEPTLSLQIAYSDFLAFHRKRPNEAANQLKRALELNLSSYQEGLVKLKLGDILVLQEKFNEALIYFTQIQTSLKNSTLSQEARFKVARTSYYKGDFDWAETQLNILKRSTSQLIANDALDLKLIISDNKYEDSTRTALKLFAKADLFSYQNKTSEAITTLNQIINNHKGESIVDEALFTQAKLYEKTTNYSAAADNYLSIISNYKEDILIDDACFNLAELYRTQLDLEEEAKSFYEKIIFEHEDSIYFVQARKHYRSLRGDTIE